jgi:hypothetical protein
VTYRMSFWVNISYGSALVFQHAYQSAETLQLLVPKKQFENGTVDPAKDHDPHSLLVGTKNLWNKIDTLPATHGVVNAPLVAATATLVQTKLVLLQRAFYAVVSQRFVRAGDAVQLAAAVLNGWRAVWGPSSLPGCRCVRRPMKSFTRCSWAATQSSPAATPVAPTPCSTTSRTSTPFSAVKRRIRRRPTLPVTSPPLPSIDWDGCRVCWTRSSRTSIRRANRSLRSCSHPLCCGFASCCLPKSALKAGLSRQLPLVIGIKMRSSLYNYTSAPELAMDERSRSTASRQPNTIMLKMLD